LEVTDAAAERVGGKEAPEAGGIVTGKGIVEAGL
jgi:hypothetical protein